MHDHCLDQLVIPCAGVTQSNMRQKIDPSGVWFISRPKVLVMESFKGKGLGLVSLWVIALELQLTATRCVNTPKATFCCCYVYRRNYATYGQVVFPTFSALL